MKPILATFLLPFILFMSGIWESSVVSQTCKPSIDIDGAPEVCTNGSVKLTANAAESYKWSTGATTQSITVTEGGNYWVTTTNTDGCEGKSDTITIEGKPNASIADPINFFTFCSYSSNQNTFNLTIENTSTTKSTNAKYEISWGDGPTNTILGKSFETTTHSYTKPGSFDLKLTVTGDNGCISTKTERVFIGSNPSLGLASRGNTNDCAPATFIFDILNTEGNSAQTVYTFQFDDGSKPIIYEHSNLPPSKTIEHTFNESSKGKPLNSFTLSATAENPCGITPATVGGIKISKGPEAGLGLDKMIGCVNEPVKLNDKTISGFNANSTNPNATATYTVDWKIFPNTGWEFVSGTAKSSNPLVKFLEPGNYTIRIISTPVGSGTKCLADSAQKVIKVNSLPIADFDLKNNGICAPSTVEATNTSTGDDLQYNWQITPATGWVFANSKSASSKDAAFTFNKSGKYTITLKSTNNCTTSSKVSTVTIQDKPLVTLPASQTYCGPQQISFSSNNPKHTPTYDAQESAITAYAWQVNGPGNVIFENNTSSASSNPDIKFTTPGKYEVKLTSTNACGTSEAATQIITINALPELTINSTKKELCIGESTTLSITGADSYKWSPATGLSSTTGNSVTANPAQTTTYNITGTNSATGCSSSTTYTLVVNPLPVIQVTSDVASICQGQTTATLTASGADTYSWSPASGLSATTGATVNATPDVTTTYTVTGYNTATGCSSTNTVKITVNQLPQVNAGADLTVCNKPVTTKLVGSPAGGKWSGQNVTNDGTFTPPSQTGSYELTYTYTNALGCSNSDMVLVTVQEAPVADASEDKVVCLNSGSFNLIASPTGGTWTGSHVTAAGKFTPSAVGTFKLTYSYGAGSCLTTDEVQVTVNALPTAPVATGTTICPGFTTTLNTDNTPGNIAWFDTPTGGKKVGTGSTFTTPVLDKTTSYYVETTIEGGCTSTRREVKVNVRPATPAPVVQPLTLCGSGNKAILVAEGNATTYQWFETATSTDVIFTGKTFDAGITNSSRTYFVQASIEGCISLRAEAKITVYPVLSNNILTPVPTICAGQKPATILGKAPEGGNEVFTYTWESSITGANSGFTKINGATQQNYSSGELTRTTWIRRKVSSATCNSTSDAIEVTVTPVITANTIRTSSNTVICENSIADEITGSEPEGGSGTYTFIWQTSTAGAEGPYVSAIGNNKDPNYSPGSLSITTWFRRVVSSGTCSNHVSEPVKITIYKPIVNNSITGEATICEAETPAVLQGSQPEAGDGKYTFRWEMSHNGTDFELAIGDNNAINYATGPLTTTTWFRRVVSGGPCGTNISNSVKITVNPTITKNTITAVTPICSGQEAPQLSAATPEGGNGSYQYKWVYSTTGANGNYNAAPVNNTDKNYSPGVLTQTTWYKREITSGACTSTSAVVEVTVNPLPVAPTVNPITICENSAATLTVLETSGSYKWYSSADSKVAIHSGKSYITPTLTDNTTYYVETVSSNGCGSPQRAAVTVTVNKGISNNTIVTSASQLICAGQTPGLISGSQPEQGNGNYSYQWERSTTGTNSGFTSISGATASSYQPQSLSTTTWFRRVVSAGPCAVSNSNAVEIQVVPVLSNNTISVSQTVCEGDVPTKFTGSTPTGGTGTYTYVWQSSTDGSNFTTIANAPNDTDYKTPNGLTQTTWYRRIVTSGPCAQDISAVIKVTVQPSIVGNILSTANQTICEGATPIQITGATPTGGNNSYTYTWEMSTDGTLFTDASGTRTNPNYQPQVLSTTTWFRRKVVSGKCESYSAPIKVTVNAIIAANQISESQTICTETAPKTFKGTQPTGGDGNYAFRWEYSTTGNPNDFKAVALNGASIDYTSGALSSSTWFRRVVTSGACSHVSNTVKVNVSPEINNNTIVLSQNIYAGQTPSPLTGSSPTGGNGNYTYVWEYSENGVNYMPAIVPNTGKHYAPGALTKDTWYRRTVYSGGCENVSAPVKISVTPAIGNNIVQADQVICFGNKPATIIGTTPAGGAGAYQFIWQQSTSGPTANWTTAIGTSNTQNYNPPTLSQHTWYRRIVISGQNTDTSEPVMITVKPAMSNNRISTSQTICFNTAPSLITGSLPTGGSGSYTYLWEISTEGADKGFSTAPGANNKQDYNSGTLSLTVWVRRVVSSESCDRLISEPVKITVNPQPQAPDAKDVSTCAGSKATLTAQDKGGRIEWYASASGGAPLGFGKSFTTPVLQNATTYYVQEVSLSCASERREVKVSVTESTANAGLDVTIVKGRSAELHASGGVKYTWSPAETLSDPNGANPVAKPDNTTTYTVTVETEAGCKFTDQVTVTVLPHVSVPNTFTPNRDGINDTWEIPNIEKYPNCKVQVFNQWGNLIFTSNGYKEPWNGLFQGKELPIATYYYIIHLDKTEKPLSGSITIVK